MQRFLFVILMLVSGGCHHMAQLVVNQIEEPEIKAVELSVRKITFRALTLNVKLDILNKNDFDIDLQNFDYKISGSEGVLGQGKISKKVSLISGGISTINMPLAVHTSNVLKLIKKMDNPKVKAVNLVASCEALTPFGTKELFWEKVVDLKLPKLSL